MSIFAIQHVSFETLGLIEEWNNNITYIKVYQGDAYPKIKDIEMLIVLGGPMGVYDDTPFLISEKSFIKSVIDNNIPTLGICLGAQMIADIIGGKVYKGAHKEVGWFPVSLSEQGRITPPFDVFPNKITIFQWHGDTYELPEEAITIFEGDVIKEQGYIYKGNVIGLQFHFEMKKQGIERLVKADGAYIDDSTYSYTKKQILSLDIPNDNKSCLNVILDYLYSKSR